MDSRESIAERLRSWICSEPLAGRPDVELNDDTELLRSGYIDSLDTMRLLVFMEHSFGVEIPDEEIVPGSFRSINAMVDLVSLLRSRRASMAAAGGNGRGDGTPQVTGLESHEVA